MPFEKTLKDGDDDSTFPGAELPSLFVIMRADDLEKQRNYGCDDLECRGKRCSDPAPPKVRTARATTQRAAHDSDCVCELTFARVCFVCS